MRITHALAFVLIFNLSACGRYGDPLPPEAFAPAQVQELTVVPKAEGLVFQWKSPEVDRRGKELDSLEGYSIYRSSDVDEFEDFLRDPEELGEERAALEDTSVVVRDEKRKEAREKSLPSRRIGQSDELVKFEFLDSGLVPGTTYGYVIVPKNQDGVEGDYRQFVRVEFRGERSVVEMIDVTDLDSLKPEIFR